jgi:hypothetical protein
VSINVLGLMFCGGLFVQAIGVGSNHERSTRHFDQSKIMKKTHHCHHATRWSSNGDDLNPKETRCNTPKTTRSRSSTYSDQFTRSLCSHQFMHKLKGEQQDIFGSLKAPWSYASNESRIKSIGGSYKRVWPNYRRLHVLKFSGQHAWAETKRP